MWKPGFHISASHWSWVTWAWREEPWGNLSPATVGCVQGRACQPWKLHGPRLQSAGWSRLLQGEAAVLRWDLEGLWPCQDWGRGPESRPEQLWNINDAVLFHRGSVSISFICSKTYEMRELPRRRSGKESACQCRRWKKTKVQSLGREDPLEEEMATHSRILSWEVLWTEEPGGLLSVGSQRIGHDWAHSLSHTHTLRHIHTH